MNTTTPQHPIIAPALDIDMMMFNRYGQKVSPTGKLERRIVANLIAHIEAAGFQVHSVNDGDDIIAVADAKAAMELIFNLDEASLRFYKGGPKGASQQELDADDWHGVLLVLGNGIDIISDWNWTRGDADGFNAAMDAFDAEAFA